MTEDERAKALRAIEDAIDAMSEQFCDCGSPMPGRYAADAVLDRLIELGWSKS